MTIMIDSNVLSDLILEEPEPGPDRDAWRASRECVAMHGSVRCSALAWFEVFRYRRADGTLLGDRLDAVSKQVRVEPLDIGVAERGARLLDAARVPQKLCSRCYNAEGTHTCVLCGRIAGKNLKLNDALIVAHADVLSEITHLYTHDGGQLTLGGMTRPTLQVLRPPPATGRVIVARRHHLAPADGTPAEIDPAVSGPIPLVDESADSAAVDASDADD